MQILDLPKEAKILTAQIQVDKLCLWALVDPEEKIESRVIQIFGTGHDVEPNANLRYISTVQLVGGQLIYHIFEEVGK